MKICVCLLIMLITISGGSVMSQMEDNAEYEGINKVSLRELSETRIFFGHQSVGFNIMDGVNDIIKSDSSLMLKVKKTKDPLGFAEDGLFAHDMIGKNEDPEAKILDFKRLVENGIGDKVDIAFFKFCYVDVHRNTDIKKLFALYIDTMDDLQKSFPNVHFLHFTVPIRVRVQGIKLNVKRFLGMTIDDDEDALKRMLFNNMLREKYSKTGKLFDLAAWESTYSDGKRNLALFRGKSVEFLIPEYSQDGRHLKENGRIFIATRLLDFLCKQN